METINRELCIADFCRLVHSFWSKESGFTTWRAKALLFSINFTVQNCVDCIQIWFPPKLKMKWRVSPTAQWAVLLQVSSRITRVRHLNIIFWFSLVIIVPFVPDGRQPEQMMPRICAALPCSAALARQIHHPDTRRVISWGLGNTAATRGDLYERETTRRGIITSPFTLDRTNTHT